MCLSILLLMDICVASTLELLSAMLLFTLLNIHFGEHTLYLSMYLKIEFFVYIHLALRLIANTFSQRDRANLHSPKPGRKAVYFVFSVTLGVAIFPNMYRDLLWFLFEFP